MRISTALGVALLIAVAPAASAQGPVATVLLAVGEVLLELNSMGSATARADSAEIAVFIPVEGDDEATRTRLYRRAVDRISAAARSAGAEITADELVSYDAMANAIDVDMNSTVDMNIPTEAVYPSSGGGFAIIRLRNVARVDQLTQSIQQAGGEITGTTYRVSDDRAARRQARDNAIAAARAEAEAYAASLGMRVGRIARVTERTQLDFFEMMMTGGSETMNAAMAQAVGVSDGRDVQSLARVGVDFILVPR